MDHPQGRNRLLIFGDPQIGFTGILLDAFLTALRTRSDIQLVAVCDTGRERPLDEPWFSLVGWCRRRARVAFHPELRGEPSLPRLYRAARRHRVRVMVPPGRDVNSTAFLSDLRHRLRPTLALSLGCKQIFRRELLDCFEMAVNFHDGYLPDYRGLGATAWSLYKKEPRTGYTFHAMDAGIDTGAVLVRDCIPVPPGATASRIRFEKLKKAAGEAGTVLDHLVRQSAGSPQNGAGSHFSLRDGERIRTIDDPGQLTGEEILHRLHCFEILRIQIQGRGYEVTALDDAPRGAPLSFTTSDQRRLAPRRCLFLPVWLYRFYRRYPFLRRL